MKKVSFLVLALAAAAALGGCGGNNSTGSTTAEEQPSAAPNPNALPVTQAGPVPRTPTAPAPPPTTVTLTLTVKGGKPVGGQKHWKVAKGKRVAIVVASDRTDRVHLHGYDVAADVTPGKAARLSFKATIAGRFELESHESDLAIAELEVR